jgi:hypothetical protein
MTNIPEENLEQMPVSVQCTGNILMIKDPCVEDRVCSAFPQGLFAWEMHFARPARREVPGGPNRSDTGQAFRGRSALEIRRKM